LIEHPHACCQPGLRKPAKLKNNVPRSFIIPPPPIRSPYRFPANSASRQSSTHHCRGRGRNPRPETALNYRIESLACHALEFSQVWSPRCRSRTAVHDSTSQPTARKRVADKNATRSGVGGFDGQVLNEDRRKNAAGRAPHHAPIMASFDACSWVLDWPRIPPPGATFIVIIR